MDPMFDNTETSLLFNLRSQSVNEFKGNFSISFCQFCKSYLDTQDHALSCNMLRNHMKKELIAALDRVKYNDIFGKTHSQLKITKVFKSIIHVREQLRAPPLNPAYPGNSTGPGG